MTWISAFIFGIIAMIVAIVVVMIVNICIGEEE